MEAKAAALYVRIAPRSARWLDLIRGKSVQEAMGILQWFMPKRGSRLIEKVLTSAVANAQNNLDLDPSGYTWCELM